MSALALLTEAREWLDDPEHWCSGAFLRYEDGEIVASDAAGSYYVGPLTRGESLPDNEDIRVINRLLSRIAREMGYEAMHQLNDHGGHMKALELLNRGLTELEEQRALIEDVFSETPAELLAAFA